MNHQTGKLMTAALILFTGLVWAGSALAFSSFGKDVNTFCSQTQPFTGDCTLCHTTGSKSDPTPAKSAYKANDLCFFCGSEPQCNTGPTCTDLDKDGFYVEGQACGTMADCDDSNAAINPGAAENCSDGIDNNCNGLIDSQDPAAVGCPAQCTDADNDGFNVDGTAGCGPQDCDDQDAAINPGTAEVCGDNIDNDCDGQVDEGCVSSCPDADADGFTDAACGGSDCDDAEPLINPGMKDLCGNGIDENCNGLQDDICAACPGGGAFMVKKASYDFKKGRLDVKGKATVGGSVQIFDAETGSLLASGVPVKGDEWKARIELDEAPARISAQSDAGCQAEQDVTVKGRGDHDEDDPSDDDHGDDRGKDKRKKQHDD
ncbi:hypothetical protein C2E25_08795 [Geothermobacter hydrogeniphilus]|uniref:Metal-binding motif-containing protein n=1 Tax=Geothermobacter hydrogeniphilus TaxID=1969733 RepID=A0A2K2HA86_9BACT|nr:putative metal-binding motif-containing protein [Geothermobacter hydrogeniphilus]PNU20139.1 hypothetical protein C2E25_08795 [Geothermobacter hydrogeniphilus]